MTPVAVGTACIYCGELATSIDHIPAQLHRVYLTPEDYPFREVPACQPCNSALGAREYHTLEARMRWIQSYLAEKLAKLANDTRWSDEDLAALGPSLRKLIRRRMAREASLRRREAFARIQAERAPEDVLRGLSDFLHTR